MKKALEKWTKPPLRKWTVGAGLLAALFCGHVLAQNTVDVRVVGDEGEPIENAEVSIVFVHPAASKSKPYKGLTDKEGKYSARDEARHSMTVWVRKEGYYYSFIKSLRRDEDHDLEIVLRKIVNPHPMWALRAGGGKIPEGREGKWTGWDLEVNDWVAPHGTGKVVDLEVKMEREFLGWGNNSDEFIEKMRNIYREEDERAGRQYSEEVFRNNVGVWKGVAEYRFPDPEAGLIPVVEGFLPYSQMKIPHQAPESGYQSEGWRSEGIRNGGKIDPDRKLYNGFYIRTRIRRDENGEIIGSRYGKFNAKRLSDGSTGGIGFNYALNAEDNDRHLESDSKRSLFRGKTNPQTGREYDPLDY